LRSKNKLAAAAVRGVAALRRNAHEHASDLFDVGQNHPFTPERHRVSPL
jgi:hypothetical protein